MKEKLSAIMIKLGQGVLKNPNGIPSSEAAHAVLFLSNIAWNREVMGKDSYTSKQIQMVIEVFERSNCKFWKELKSRNLEELIQGLRQFKRKYYPDDNRIVKSCGTNERGNIQVIWE